jgi:5-deoxy-D-glucuronate isomerase
VKIRNVVKAMMIKKNSCILVLAIAVILFFSGCLENKDYLGEYHDSKNKTRITLLEDQTYILNPPSGLIQKGTYTVDEKTHTITIVSAFGTAVPFIYNAGKLTDPEGNVFTQKT